MIIISDKNKLSLANIGNCEEEPPKNLSADRLPTGYQHATDS